MGREMKKLFRSWSDEEKVFYYFKNGCYYKDVDCKIIINETMSNDFDWENAEQFTGVIDDNYNMVFEGDKTLYDGVMGIVSYDNDVCMFLVRFEYTRSIHNFDFLERDIKVIGNIHEK